MSGRRFDVADVAEVLLMWQSGHSSREIARVLGMGRDRIRAIIRRAQSHGYVANQEPLAREEWRECAALLFSDRAAPLPSVQRQELERFRGVIQQGLETETAVAVWRRLHDEHGLDVALRTFRRYASEVRVGYSDQAGIRTALLVQLGSARQRIRDLEAELHRQRISTHMARETSPREGLRASG